MRSSARGISFAIGVAGLLAARALAPVATLAIDPAPAPPRFLATPVPIAMATPRPTPVLLPTVVAAVPAMLPPLEGCPPVARDDELAPIGRPATAAELSPDPGRAIEAIAASSTRPVLALIAHDGGLEVSDDDGRRWRAPLTGHVMSSVAVDDRGRIYAIGDGGLAVIDDDGHRRARWTAITCPHDACVDRVVAVPGGVAHLHDRDLRVSRDGGRTWRAVVLDGDGELTGELHLFALGARLYGVRAVDDMCGWHADEIVSIDLATAAARYQSFSDDAPAHLDVVDDAGATWRYAARAVPTAAAARDLLLARKSPAVGARALFAEHGDLIELCGARARLVSHAYGADQVDAVDAAGRPLLIRGDTLTRWSPRFGWRVLYGPDPAAAPPGDGE